MSVFTLDYSSNNPVTKEVLNATSQSLGVTIKEDEQDEYQTLLAVFHDSAEALMAMPDYVPSVDLERFPRKDVHFPDPSENPSNAWAWKCSIQDPSAEGILKGKTIAIKDNIAVKDVPMLMGTDFIKGYIPVCVITLHERYQLLRCIRTRMQQSLLESWKQEVTLQENRFARTCVTPRPAAAPQLAMFRIPMLKAIAPVAAPLVAVLLLPTMRLIWPLGLIREVQSVFLPAGAAYTLSNPPLVSYRIPRVAQTNLPMTIWAQ